VLVTAAQDLPNVLHWLSTDDAGKATSLQWRSGQGGERPELWDHVSWLFKALASIHESRIIHRRISPMHVLVDESHPRDQQGFLKLGGFEASTFVRAYQASIAGTYSGEGSSESSLLQSWFAPGYLDEVFNGQGLPEHLVGTFAADVFGMLSTCLWLLSGKPSNGQLARAFGLRSNAERAAEFRQQIVREAVASLPTVEQDFFSPLVTYQFSPEHVPNRFSRDAARIAQKLRQGSVVAEAPLCVVVSPDVQEKFCQWWPSEEGQLERRWRSDVFQQACQQGVMWHEPAATNPLKLLTGNLLLEGQVFKRSDGSLDPRRLWVSRIRRGGQSRRAEAIGMGQRPLKVLESHRSSVPINAARWDLLFEHQEEEPNLVVRALEELNMLELGFWEADVVPVRISSVQVRGTAERKRQESVEVVLHTADPNFPLNPQIRRPKPPQFSALFEKALEAGKKWGIRVDLSKEALLYNRHTDIIPMVTAPYQVTGLQETESDEEVLQLYRLLEPNEPSKSEGDLYYLKTLDQGWQMGLFNRRKRAIQSLDRHATLADVLVDADSRTVTVEPLPLKLPFKDWSEEKDALVACTLATAPLYLVQGPPGTGKSTFVRGLMKHLLSDGEDPTGRILVVAQMHSAINDLRRRVDKIFAGESGESSWGPPLLLRLNSQGKTDDETRSDELVCSARDIFAPCLRRISEYSAQEYRDLRTWLTYQLAAEKVSPVLEQRLISAASIIFTTCTDKYLDAMRRIEFDWVIVEEASRIVGCDMVIPMRLGHRWVLIGDPEQLGAYRRDDFMWLIDEDPRAGVLGVEDEDPADVIVRDEDVKMVSKRLLEPFKNVYRELEHTRQSRSLWEQHRMHPDICDLVSNVFYGGKLRTADNRPELAQHLFDHEGTFLRRRAVVWLNVPHLVWPNRKSSVDTQPPGEFSYYNASEARVVEYLLRHIICQQASLPEDRPLELAMITPYRQQQNVLRKVVRSLNLPDWVRFEGVFTADAYQGHEADIVILSLVRNNRLFKTGFLDQNRMDVAFSRARRLLIVVGCLAMLEQRATNLREDELYIPKLVEHIRPFVLSAHEVLPEVLA